VGFNTVVEKNNTVSFKEEILFVLMRIMNVFTVDNCIFLYFITR